MTVRITKEGKVPNFITVYSCTCTNCKTEFEYENSDIKRVTVAYYGPVDCDEEEVIYCPLCHRQIKHRGTFGKKVEIV